MLYVIGSFCAAPQKFEETFLKKPKGPQQDLDLNFKFIQIAQRHFWCPWIFYTEVKRRISVANVLIQVGSNGKSF